MAFYVQLSEHFFQRTAIVFLVAAAINVVPVCIFILDRSLKEIRWLGVFASTCIVFVLSTIVAAIIELSLTLLQ